MSRRGNFVFLWDCIHGATGALGYVVIVRYLSFVLDTPLYKDDVFELGGSFLILHIGIDLNSWNLVDGRITKRRSQHSYGKMAFSVSRRINGPKRIREQLRQ